jgi:hypothetical protein
MIVRPGLFALSRRCSKPTALFRSFLEDARNERRRDGEQDEDGWGISNLI